MIIFSLPGHKVCLRNLSRLLGFMNTKRSHIDDVGVVRKLTLQLRRSDLISLVLYEFLQSIGEIQVVSLAYEPEITSLEESINPYRAACLLRIVPVSLEYIRLGKP